MEACEDGLDHHVHCLFYGHLAEESFKLGEHQLQKQSVQNTLLDGLLI